MNAGPTMRHMIIGLMLGWAIRASVPLVLGACFAATANAACAPNSVLPRASGRADVRHTICLYDRQPEHALRRGVSEVYAADAGGGDTPRFGRPPCRKGRRGGSGLCAVAVRRLTQAERRGALEKSPTCPYCREAPSTQADHIMSLKRNWESGGWADERATGTARINDPAQELVRRAEGPGPFHNFPESFNDDIFERGLRTVVPDFFKELRRGLSNDSIQYRLAGEINDRPGSYEIFVRPALSGRTEVITIASSVLILSALNDIAVELVFPAEYDVRVLEELPARSAAIEFARYGRVGDGGVLVEVISSADGVWSGVVATAPESVAATHSGIYSTPAPAQVCIIARGDAYFIDTANPARWWVLEDAPIVSVRSAPSDSVLALATPWKVVGVGPQGVKWRTSRIAINGIELGEVAGGRLVGTADPRDYESREFVIQLSTGDHRGGFPFPG